MKDYPIRMTSGQTFFVTVCFLFVSFITFYLGARFGPEIFWNIQVDRINQETLLPSETSEQELAMLLKDETVPTVTFHEELQKKNSTVGPLENSKLVDIPLLVKEPLKENIQEAVPPAVVVNESDKKIVPEAKPKQVALNLEKPKKKESSVLPSITHKPVVKQTAVSHKPETTPKQNPPSDPIQNQIDHEINW